MSKQYDEYLKNHIEAVQHAMAWMYDYKIFDTPGYLYKTWSHDSSKFTPEEYQAYDDYFYGNPEKTKEEINRAFNYAWLHHIHKNPHHWQHWLLQEDEGTLNALEMPERYVYEMVADWWSFSWVKQNLTEIFDWYEEHKGKMILHENTRALVEDILFKIKGAMESE